MISLGTIWILALVSVCTVYLVTASDNSGLTETRRSEAFRKATIVSYSILVFSVFLSIMTWIISYDWKPVFGIG